VAKLPQQGMRALALASQAIAWICRKTARSGRLSVRTLAPPAAVAAALVLLLTACAPEELRYLADERSRGIWLDAPAPVALPALPDPTQNDATVPGVDSNGNWVRDDVELWITQTYGRQPQQVAALTRVAVAAQKTLVVGLAIEGKQPGAVPGENWLAAAESVMRGNVMAGACVLAVFGAYGDASAEREKARIARAAVEGVVTRVANTPERIRAFAAVQRLVQDNGAVVKPLEASLDPCRSA
jgi:hypothetical protein